MPHVLDGIQKRDRSKLADCEINDFTFSFSNLQSGAICDKYL